MHVAPATTAASQLRVANFNVENLFDTVARPDGSDAGNTPSRADYDAKVAKLSTAIADTLRGSDIIALQEVENLDVLEDLVAHPTIKALGYRPLLVEGNDARGIDTGFLYLPERVTPTKVETPNPVAPDGLDDGAGQVDPSRLFARPPLVATFAMTGAAAQGVDGVREITLINNHFKSKARASALGERRLEQAKYVAGLVDAKRATDPSANVVVIGDLNSLPGEEPLRQLEQRADGSRRLHDTPDALDAADRYTYIYRGDKNLLDHVFVTPELHGRVANVEIPHINSGGHTDLSDPTSPRNSSDHDPIITTFDLG